MEHRCRRSRTDTPCPLVAQAVAPEERAELEQMQQQADLAYRRATTLFTVLLTLMVLLVAVGVVMLWVLRRSVVQEVATVVRGQLNQMTDLENRIRSATRDLNTVLKDAEDVADTIDQQAEDFKDDLADKAPCPGATDRGGGRVQGTHLEGTGKPR
jgi:hypothetical protein